MTRSVILRKAAEYADLLRSVGVTPRHSTDPDLRLDPQIPGHRQTLLEYSLWTCEYIPRQIDRLAGHHRCMRWLGYIQGALTAYGILTITESREAFEEFVPDLEREEDTTAGRG